MIDELADRIAPVVLANITTRYPYHDSHMSVADEPLHDPFAAHPAFGNSFDWHSSVHSHWTALQLIEHFSRLPQAPAVSTQLEDAVAANLRAENLALEAAYLSGRSWYERPYGWAWAMSLAAVSERSENPAGRAHAPALRALSESIGSAARKWLDVIPMPVRHGVHSNSAFALRLIHEASKTMGMIELKESIEERARAWFQNDRDWPQHFERSGSDFLSPGMTEADLMLSILPAPEFAEWLERFLPGLSAGSPICSVVRIPDVDDGHVVHLHGLNLSRAASLCRIARALEREELFGAARALYEASVLRATTGYYSETHWLPTFAWAAAAELGS